MQRRLLILSLTLTLAACAGQSGIQNKYTAQQDKCRDEVTRTLSGTDSSSGATAAQSAAAGSQFSECMNKSGWRVSSPKSSGQAAASGTPPVGGVAPSEGTSAITRPAPQSAALQNPPTGAPSVKPSAAISSSAPPVTGVEGAPVPSAPAAATYQPARPASVASPSYGQGAGRQF
jgi:hypothetical protein